MDRQSAWSKPRSATHSSRSVGSGTRQASPVIRPCLEQGAGAEPATELLVGHQVEHHVAPRRLTGSRQDVEGADGRAMPPFMSALPRP